MSKKNKKRYSNRNSQNLLIVCDSNDVDTRERIRNFEAGKGFRTDRDISIDESYKRAMRTGDCTELLMHFHR